MKRFTLLKTMLLLCALIVGSGSAWAQKTFDFQQSTEAYGWTGGTPAGGASGTMTVNEKFTNGDVEFIYTSKNASTDIRWWNTSDGLRLYGTTGPKTNQFKIKALNGRKIKSITYEGTFVLTEVASPATGTIKNKTYTAPSGGITEVEFKGTHTTGNKNLKYITVTLEPIDPTIDFSDGNIRVGQNLDLSTLFSSNSSGTVTYSITAGGSYASLDGSTLTGVAIGDVTVQASQAAASGYNTGSATATITVQEALTLSSIAITTPPTKTVYTEGESFDPTGMVVTATYTNESTENVTAACTFTPSGELTTNDNEITVSYTENGDERTTTQAITVNEYVQPKTITISNWNTLFGTAFDGAASGTNYNGTINNVQVNYVKTSGSDLYIKNNEIRAYNGSSVEFIAPTGYRITKIEFTKGSNWNSTITITGGGSLSGNKWTNATGSQSVKFAPGGRTDFQTNTTITLAQTATISLNAACNDGEGNIYGTYSNAKSFIVPEGLTVSAVGISDGKLVVTHYEEGAIVKAGTGVMVSAESDINVDKVILLSDEDGTEISGNCLKASGDAGIVAAAMAAAAPSCKYYRLTMHNPTAENKIGFWWGAPDGAAFDVAANKAYLAVPSPVANARSGFNLFGDDDTTGIEELKNSKTEELKSYYNLNGQRIANPSKGLYIVNGKKVIIK